VRAPQNDRQNLGTEVARQCQPGPAGGRGGRAALVIRILLSILLDPGGLGVLRVLLPPRPSWRRSLHRLRAHERAVDDFRKGTRQQEGV